jgi:methylated-DNA-[protein]-cysteine S-methyltransferase
MKNIYIGQGPAISVQIDFSGPLIGKISLVRNTREEVFSCILSNTSHATRELEKKILVWLESYGKGQPLTDLQFSLTAFGPFTANALNTLGTIPFASTASYKEIAIRLGRPHAARAVGNACRVNPFPLFIPCHRVLRSDGGLGGFAFGEDVKKCLLDFEKFH